MEKTFQVKEFLSLAFKKAKENFSNFLQIYLAFFIVMIIFQVAVQSTSKELPILSLIISLVIGFLGLILGLNFLRYYLALKRDEKVSFSDFFRNFGDIILDTKLWLSYLGAALLSGIVIMAGLIVFVVPGIILGISLSPMLFLVIDKNYKILDAFKVSFKLTKGYKNKIFLAYLAFFAITLISLAIPYIILSYVYNIEIAVIILGAVILLIYGFITLFSGILMSSIYDFLYENYDQQTSIAKPAETAIAETKEQEETETIENDLDNKENN
jgi:hypothetical protein